MNSLKHDPAVAARLRATVEQLAALGERSTRRPVALKAAADWLRGALGGAGWQTLDHVFPADGVSCVNVEAVPAGFSPRQPHLLVGAHYDSAWGTPGADDNLSAVAILLELAGRLTAEPAPEPVRLVAFANEEPPHFLSATMGSLVFARKCRADGDALTAMICLESLGIFHDEPGTQMVPRGYEDLVPEPEARGNFVAVVGNNNSLEWTGRCCQAFRADGRLPSIGASLPDLGVSDHWSFWQCEFPAVMLTDTAMFRNPHYHDPEDTPEKLNYPAMAVVADVVEAALRGT